MYKKPFVSVVLLVALSVLWVGCGGGGDEGNGTPAGSVSVGGICTTDADCTSGLVCLSGQCTTPDVLIPDTDTDGVTDDTDNCKDAVNAGQEDADADGMGNACDPDADNDGLENTSDNCPYTDNPSQTDSDTDGNGDACDTDWDNDTVLNNADNCPNMPNAGQENMDADGMGDVCDDDIDGDGHLPIASGGDDCNDINAATYPGAIDKPDLSYTDLNCDGYDGDVDGAFWVSQSTGNDANPGTLALPFKTIQKGIDSAYLSLDPNKVDVYLISDTPYVYATALSIWGGGNIKGIYAGFAIDGSRNLAVNNKLINARWNIAKDVEIQGLMMYYDNNTNNYPVATVIASASPSFIKTALVRGTANTFANAVEIDAEAPGEVLSEPLFDNCVVASLNCTVACNSVAIYAHSGGAEHHLKLTLRNNVIGAGDIVDPPTLNSAVPVNLFAVADSKPRLVAEGNLISAGKTTNFSSGILLGADGKTLAISTYGHGSADISRNKISGGEGGVFGSFGIYDIYPSEPTRIYNNFIHGGSGDSSTGVSLVVTHGFTNIANNTINAGAGSNAYAIKIWANSTPVIENNILFGQSTINKNTGIMELATTAHPWSMIGNLFDDSLVLPGSVLYHDESPAPVDIVSMAGVNGLTDIPHIGSNIDGDAMSYFTNLTNKNYHLLAGSPAIGMAAEGTVSPLGVDFDNEARPAAGTPSDIGADEIAE